MMLVSGRTEGMNQGANGRFKSTTGFYNSQIMSMVAREIGQRGSSPEVVEQMGVPGLVLMGQVDHLGRSKPSC